MKQILDSLTASLPASELPDYNCNNGAWMRVIGHATPEHLTIAVHAAEDLGFRRFAENELEGNRYITMTRSDAVAHIYYCPSEQTLRLIADPNTTLFDPTPKPFVRCCQTKLWQFETDHSFIDCGMCFILQNADKSFFLIDSGHYLQPNDHRRIYRFLRERTPWGEKVIIAGWFLSHGHDDHVCQFMEFLRRHRTAVLQYDRPLRTR